MMDTLMLGENGRSIPGKIILKRFLEQSTRKLKERCTWGLRFRNKKGEFE